MTARNDFRSIDAESGDEFTGVGCTHGVPEVPVEASDVGVEPVRPVDPSSIKESRRQDLGDRIAYGTLVATVLVAFALGVGHLAGVPWLR